MEDVQGTERTGSKVDIFRNQNTMELRRQLEGEPWQHSKPCQTEQLLLRKPKQWVLSGLVTMLLFVTQERAAQQRQWLTAEKENTGLAKAIFDKKDEALTENEKETQELDIKG